MFLKNYAENEAGTSSGSPFAFQKIFTTGLKQVVCTLVSIHFKIP